MLVLFPPIFMADTKIIYGCNFEAPLKLQIQEKPSRMFSLAYNLPKAKSNLCPSKLRRKKSVNTTCIFRPLKLHRKKYVEITSIFRPAKLYRKKYMETTWIFRPSILHRKSTQKLRGNSSRFGLRRIDVISTSNGDGFDVVYPLGICLPHCLYALIIRYVGIERFNIKSY